LFNNIIHVFSSASVDQLDVKFDEMLKCITVAGLADSVEIATKFVKTNYVDVICMDKLEIVQPGDIFCQYLLDMVMRLQNSVCSYTCEIAVSVTCF